MSGIVGILNGDGQPIDPTLLQLQQMTDLMAPVAPDAQETWSQGNVGFGHALLRNSLVSRLAKVRKAYLVRWQMT